MYPTTPVSSVLAVQESVTLVAEVRVAVKLVGVEGAPLSTGETVIETLFVSDPKLLVQASVYEEVDVGETFSLPDVAFVPLQSSLAVHAVASVALHVSFEDSPTVILVGDAENVRDGLVPGFTVSDTCFELERPKASEQESV